MSCQRLNSVIVHQFMPLSFNGSGQLPSKQYIRVRVSSGVPVSQNTVAVNSDVISVIGSFNDCGSPK